MCYYSLINTNNNNNNIINEQNFFASIQANVPLGNGIHCYFTWMKFEIGGAPHLSKEQATTTTTTKLASFYYAEIFDPTRLDTAHHYFITKMLSFRILIMCIYMAAQIERRKKITYAPTLMYVCIEASLTLFFTIFSLLIVVLFCCKVCSCFYTFGTFCVSVCMSVPVCSAHIITYHRHLSIIKQTPQHKQINLHVSIIWMQQNKLHTST